MVHGVLLNIRQEIQQLILTWLIVIFILLIIGYSMKISAVYSRRVLLSWMVLTPVLLSCFRYALRTLLKELRQRERNAKHAIIVGAGEQGMYTAQEIHRLDWMGVKIAGYFDDRFEYGYQPVSEIDEEVIGKTDEIVDYLKQQDNSIDMVFIALHTSQESLIKQLLNDLSDTTVQTYVVPDLFLSDLLKTRWGYIGNMPILSAHDRPFTNIDGVLKRLEDIIFASIILCIIAIPMLIIAVLIKITSPGAVIFKQRRYGISGEPIQVWKFRTMNVCEDGDEIKQAKKGDNRVTLLGRFLRKTSIDEFPQFINVLQGTMSVVGPRPHAVAHNEQYRKEIYGYMLRHTIKPGITGWAQVNGWRGETDTLEKMEKRVDYDLWYINNWSLMLDLKIIFLTIINSNVRNNAY
jgi:putative colanic acid biosynthesis UDP-glucose lipid carrier transferase